MPLDIERPVQEEGGRSFGATYTLTRCENMEGTSRIADQQQRLAEAREALRAAHATLQAGDPMRAFQVEHYVWKPSSFYGCKTAICRLQ